MNLRQYEKYEISIPQENLIWESWQYLRLNQKACGRILLTIINHQNPEILNMIPHEHRSLSDWDRDFALHIMREIGQMVAHRKGVHRISKFLAKVSTKYKLKKYKLNPEIYDVVELCWMSMLRLRLDGREDIEKYMRAWRRFLRLNWVILNGILHHNPISESDEED